MIWTRKIRNASAGFSLVLVVLLAAWATARTPSRGVTLTGRVAVTGPGPQEKADNSNVVVWLTPHDPSRRGSESSPAPSDRPRFRLLQKHKEFIPHVLAVPVGAEVEFPNLDPFFHNVFSLYDGKRFDLGLYEAGTSRVVKFDRAGICYIFCNIHPQMSAVVVVIKTPYFGVTDKSGEFKIPEVIPGRYTLEVWNEKALPEDLKSLSREVTISESSSSLGTLRIQESGGPLLSHKNKYGREYDQPTSINPLYEQQQ